MKAAFISQFGAPSVFQYGDMPTIKPTSNEVLVKLQFAALNHVDIWVRTGSPAYKVSFPHEKEGDRSPASSLHFFTLS